MESQNKAEEADYASRLPSVHTHVELINQWHGKAFIKQQPLRLNSRFQHYRRHDQPVGPHCTELSLRHEVRAVKTWLYETHYSEITPMQAQTAWGRCFSPSRGALVDRINEEKVVILQQTIFV